jgi:hypothetical protein
MDDRACGGELPIEFGRLEDGTKDHLSGTSKGRAKEPSGSRSSRGGRIKCRGAFGLVNQSSNALWGARHSGSNSLSLLVNGRRAESIEMPAIQRIYGGSPRLRFVVIAQDGKGSPRKRAYSPFPQSRHPVV